MNIGNFTAKAVIHLTGDKEAKALPVLLRHSPGMILREGTYVLSEDALRALRKAGIRFSEVSREAAAPCLEKVAGERI
jgi:acetaldehyde dehydrogenase (acetylating)